MDETTLKSVDIVGKVWFLCLVFSQRQSTTNVVLLLFSLFSLSSADDSANETNELITYPGSFHIPCGVFLRSVGRLIRAEHDVRRVEGQVVELRVRGKICGAGERERGYPADGARDYAGLKGF
jgi:hypothetical protein